jgi:hypothetical protein
MSENDRALECVIRRRDRMATAIAACGTMTWDADAKGYMFKWPVPEGFSPDPLLVVEVDVFEDDEMIGHKRTMVWLHVGQVYPILLVAHEDGGDDDDVADDNDPTPPGLALDFDPNDLLRVPMLAETSR